MKESGITGQVQLLLSVFPTLWEAEMGEHLSPGVREQPGQRGETPAVLKNINN